jgi:uncharacterized OsmC-like protein/alpha/beta superfamily hydrolase
MAGFQNFDTATAALVIGWREPEREAKTMTAQARKVAFPRAGGDMLAARLDMPAAKPRAYAIFAHCFTCSKDIFAAARISQALAANGVVVLRFDFTGLGHSDGEFANTSFSSNVADLVAAADWLRETHGAPQILIGHSLGGAAVLAAAGKIAETRAVVSIGAPSDAAHVIKNFSADLAEINETGSAEVTLAGRIFTIRKEFIDDLEAGRQSRHIAELKKPLLIFHAPRDEVVGIDNAAAIYMAAKHPKSFVSLDNADHLLSDSQDAIYVANVLSAWAARYIAEADPGPASNLVQVSETGASKFQQLVQSRQHTLLADEPEASGGTDTGPSPYDFLSIALGACTSMTLRMYAAHKNLVLGRVSVSVDHAKVHAKDCEDCGEGRGGRIDRFERLISVEGDVDDALRDKLVEIAGKCPVHRTLEASSAVVTRIVEPDSQTATE